MSPMTNKLRRKMKKSVRKLILICSLFIIFIYLTRRQHSMDETVKDLLSSAADSKIITKMKKVLRHSRTKTAKCEIPQLQERILPVGSNSTREAACHRVKPLKDSCQIADELFKDKPIGNCDHQTKFEFCKFKSAASTSLYCNIDRCVLPVYLGYVQDIDGEKVWNQYTSASALIVRIHDLMENRRTSSNTFKSPFGFVYIKCFPKDGDLNKNGLFYDQEKENFYVLQMLLLPPLHKSNIPDSKPSNNVNINFIFIDSLSRHHFFRSLPKTVKFFTNLNSHSATKILDFQLFQSVRSRTFETLQALFSGYVNPDEKPFGVLDMPPKPLNTEEMFGRFKRQGYRILWLEDLCFRWEWGISKDLHVYNTSLTRSEMWSNLKYKLFRSNIDSLDITLASCEVLDLNDQRDPFHGLDTVCFNGRHHHEYFLEYLKMYQMYLSENNSPFFTFYESNIGHEDTGRRIQTLDHHLVEYLEDLKNLKNTLTIIMSDHGNSYGDFLQRSEEGHIELYHPAMFFIIPESVAHLLGEEKMKNLIRNQNRLISHLDLHYTLNSILIGSQSVTVANSNKRFKVSSLGLFSEISPSRTCADMPMINPNLCICEGFESTVSNDTDTVVYAHFALGKINNELQRQYRAGHQHSAAGFGRCKRLELVQFKNVRKTLLNDNKMILKMNLEVPSGVPNSDETDTFFITLSVVTGKNAEITLQQVERISGYSRYRTCADKGVDVPFCVCDITSLNSTNHNALSLDNLREDILFMASVVHDIESKCLYLVSSDNQVGLVLYAVNICGDSYFDITVEIRNVELEIFNNVPVKARVYAGEVQFLFAGVRSSPDARWSWSYSVSYKEERLM